MMRRTKAKTSEKVGVREKSPLTCWIKIHYILMISSLLGALGQLGHMQLSLLYNYVAYYENVWEINYLNYLAA